MKNRINKISVRQIICCIVGGISFLLFLGLSVISGIFAGGLEDQRMGERWSSEGEAAQISCFFSPAAAVTPDVFRGFEARLDAALMEESITVSEENPDARLWASAYSGEGEITLNNGKKSVTAKAIGIGGDFFLFHPQRLLYGTLFSGNDIMQDYVVIDEDTAWQLFGSNDVAGMQVTIGNVPHIVSGVIQRGSGYLNDGAGNDVTTVYLSYASMEAYGTAREISSYEIVMPNPISSYALNLVKEKMEIQETNMECIENSGRFSLLSVGKVFLEFGKRSMSSKAIVYPYWENMARGTEDILSLLLLLRGIFLLIPVVMLLILLIKLWKKKTWTWKDIWSGTKRAGEFLKVQLRKVGKGAKNYKKKKEKEVDFE